MSSLFADVQKFLQISIFHLKSFRECPLLFAWVAARLLHANPILSAQSGYLHIYTIPLHVVLPTVPVRCATAFCPSPIG
jgi:hypothetical protein